LPQDLHVRLIHQPGRAHWLPAPTDLLGQSGPERLDPAQNGPSADVDAAISQDAGNALGGGAQLQVVADCQQDMSRGKRWPATTLVDSLVAWRPQARHAHTARAR